MNKGVAAAGAAALLAVLAFALWSSPGTGQVFGLTDRSGEELFMTYCAACHGESARGDGPVAATLTVLPPDLTRLAQRHDGEFPTADVRDIIDGRSAIVAHGPRSMPVWGYEFWIEEGADVTAERAARDVVERLVRYLESIQVSPPNAAFR